MKVKLYLTVLASYFIFFISLNAQGEPDPKYLFYRGTLNMIKVDSSSISPQIDTSGDKITVSIPLNQLIQFIQSSAAKNNSDFLRIEFLKDTVSVFGLAPPEVYVDNYISVEDLNSGIKSWIDTTSIRINTRTKSKFQQGRSYSFKRVVEKMYKDQKKYSFSYKFKVYVSPNGKKLIHYEVRDFFINSRSIPDFAMDNSMNKRKKKKIYQECTKDALSVINTMIKEASGNLYTYQVIKYTDSANYFKTKIK